MKTQFESVVLNPHPSAPAASKWGLSLKCGRMEEGRNGGRRTLFSDLLDIASWKRRRNYKCAQFPNFSFSPPGRLFIGPHLLIIYGEDPCAKKRESFLYFLLSWDICCRQMKKRPPPPPPLLLLWSAFPFPRPPVNELR